MGHCSQLTKADLSATMRQISFSGNYASHVSDFVRHDPIIRDSLAFHPPSFEPILIFVSPSWKRILKKGIKFRDWVNLRKVGSYLRPKVCSPAAEAQKSADKVNHDHGGLLKVCDHREAKGRR